MEESILMPLTEEQVIEFIDKNGIGSEHPLSQVAIIIGIKHLAKAEFKSNAEIENMTKSIEDDIKEAQQKNSRLAEEAFRVMQRLWEYRLSIQ